MTRKPDPGHGNRGQQRKRPSFDLCNFRFGSQDQSNRFTIINFNKNTRHIHTLHNAHSLHDKQNVKNPLIILTNRPESAMIFTKVLRSQKC